MPFTLAQAGTSLVAVATDGTFSTLTLPSGVTLSSTLRPRFAILGRTVYLVNAPTINLAIDPDLSVRALCPVPPSSAPRLAAGSSTGLTGVRLVKVSHAIKNTETGELYAESPLGPASNSVTLANQSLAGTNTPISPQASVNTRRIYATTIGGSVYFHWFDLDDNTVTAWEDNLADAGLSLDANEVDDLGCPPGSAPGTRMELIVAWKDRLWGKSSDPTLCDHAIYSNNRQPWAWPEDNDFPIPPVGQDAEGITAYAPRRDELGVSRRNAVYKIVPSGTTFQVIQVKLGKGWIAPDSITVINDVAYGLGTDGVYQWTGDDFDCISDEKVRAWFTTDTYFNRAEFPNAFGNYNPATNSYELHLAAAGSTDINRWVSFCLTNRQWYGPHKTAAFTPTCRILGRDSNNTDVPYIGASNGFLHSMNHATRTDGQSSAIEFDARIILHANTPDIDKMWEQIDILSKVEASGTLTITPTVGGLDASASTALTHTLTTGREKLGYLGVGRYAQLTFVQNTNAVDCTLHAIEVPYFEWGRK